jgi:alpha-beta hydrolase superfamily lysophospholipase
VSAIQGEDDECGTSAQIEAIRRQAKGEVEVLMLADCRHSPHKDQPQAMLEAMAGFIERIC